MKTFKRIVSVLICVLILALSFSPACFAANKKELKFNSDGKFRIMMISDAHFTDQVYPEVINFLNIVLDEYKPDFVVFNGDNVTGGWFMSTPLSVRYAIDQLVSPVANRNIPFTAVFGNHDWQTVTPKKLQIKFYQRYESCMMEKGYSYLHRTANHNILIKSSDGMKNAYNMWFIDSGTKDINNEMQPVLEQEIDWYKSTCTKLKESNGGNVIPSLLFQHIPIYEVNKIFKTVDKDTEGAINCSSRYGENTYYMLDENKASGNLDSCPGLPIRNSGEYDAFVQMGDIKGVFFGHDHKNDYCGVTDDGIMLCATRTVGFQSNGEGGKRGVRIIDIDENNPDNIQTFSVFYCDYFDGPYPEQKKDYDWKLRIKMIPEYILSIFR